MKFSRQVLSLRTDRNTFWKAQQLSDLKLRPPTSIPPPSSHRPGLAWPGWLLCSPPVPGCNCAEHTVSVTPDLWRTAGWLAVTNSLGFSVSALLSRPCHCFLCSVSVFVQIYTYTYKYVSRTADVAARLSFSLSVPSHCVPTLPTPPTPQPSPCQTHCCKPGIRPETLSFHNPLFILRGKSPSPPHPSISPLATTLS